MPDQQDGRAGCQLARSRQIAEMLRNAFDRTTIWIKIWNRFGRTFALHSSANGRRIGVRGVGRDNVRTVPDAGHLELAQLVHEPIGKGQRAWKPLGLEIRFSV